MALPDKQTSTFEAIVAFITSISAMLTLFIAATMYFASYIERRSEFGLYGLAQSTIAEPLQATIARGFPMLLTILIATWGILAFTHYVVKYEPVSKYARRISEHANRDAGEPLQVSRSRNASDAARFFVVLLAFAYTVADFWADKVYLYRSWNFAHGCEIACFVYRTASKTYVGMPIAGDQDRLAIDIGDGAAVLKIDDLKSVKPYQRTSERTEAKLVKG